MQGDRLSACHLDYLGTDHKMAIEAKYLCYYLCYCNTVLSPDIQCVDHPNFGLGTLPHFILLYCPSPTALLHNLPAFISL